MCVCVGGGGGSVSNSLLRQGEQCAVIRQTCHLEAKNARDTFILHENYQNCSVDLMVMVTGYRSKPE